MALRRTRADGCTVAAVLAAATVCQSSPIHVEVEVVEVEVDDDVTFCAPRQSLSAPEDFAFHTMPDAQMVATLRRATYSWEVGEPGLLPWNKPWKGSAPSRLPVRLEIAGKMVREDASTSRGEVAAAVFENPVAMGDGIYLRQPIALANGRTGEVHIELLEDEDHELHIRSDYDPEGFEISVRMDDPPNFFLSSCAFDFLPFPKTRWHVEHDHGWVDIDSVEGYWTLGAAQPTVVLKAEGEFDGIHFVQEDYWKLLQAGFGPGADPQYFAVQFDALIGLACGVGFAALTESFNELVGPARAAILDCRFQEIGTLAITEASKMALDP